MRNKKWMRLLAYVTGSVNQELLLRNEYLAGGEPYSEGEAALEITVERSRAPFPANATIRVKATSFRSRMPPIKPNRAATRLSVANDSEALLKFYGRAA